MITEKTEGTLKIHTLSNVRKHENADTLMIATIDGYEAIFKAGTLKVGDRVVYFPVDTLVPTARPEFEFLKREGKDTHRIRASKLRGVFSMGLLLPAPDGVPDDHGALSLHFGTSRYVSPSEARLLGQEEAKKHTLASRLARHVPKLPVYGLDPLRKYADVFSPVEDLVVTEKIHGCNARYAYIGGRFWVGSHKVMRGSSSHRFVEAVKAFYWNTLRFFGLNKRRAVNQISSDVWWETAKAYSLKEKLRAHPNLVLYGEIYGQRIQGPDFKYDCKDANEIRFRAFDVYDMKTGEFFGADRFFAFCDEIGIETVPVLNVCCIDHVEEYWKPYADQGKSVFPDQLGEGIVVKPIKERTSPKVGRVAMKYAGQKYLLKSES